MLRVLFGLLIFAMAPSIANAQYHYSPPSSHIIENPFYTAMKKKEEAERKAVVQLNNELAACRSFSDNGGLFRANEFEQLSPSKLAETVRDAEVMKKKFIELRDKFGGRSNANLLPKLSSSNREFVKSGAIEKIALPLLETQLTQASSLEKTLELERERSRKQARQRSSAYRPSSGLQHSNNFGLDYELYKKNKSSFNRKTQEVVEKMAIIDMLDDRDLDAMDAKLRALGY